MIEFGVISYSLVAVLYAILCLLILASGRGRRVGGYLLTACLITFVWAVCVALQF